MSLSKYSSPLLVAVMGPTASGKSNLAETLAQKLSAELINADAFQVYKGLDIGTNKPVNKKNYHLLDLKQPNETFGVGEWIQLALPILENLYTQNRNVIVVGGTGLYIRALFEEWKELSPPPQPELRQELQDLMKQKGLPALYTKLCKLDPVNSTQIDPNNPVRITRALEKILSPTSQLPTTLPPFKKFKLGINIETTSLNQNIDQRVHQMINIGWIQEVQNLLSQSITLNAPAMRAIGYQTLNQFLQNKITLEEAITEIQTLTRQYAKKQRTWLRSEPYLITVSSKINDTLQLFNAKISP